MSGAVLTPTGGLLRAAGSNVSNLHVPDLSVPKLHLPKVNLPTTPSGLTIVQAGDVVRQAAVDQARDIVDRLRVQGPGSLPGSSLTNAQVREIERIARGRYWSPDPTLSANVRDPYTLAPVQSSGDDLTGAPQVGSATTDARPGTTADAQAGVAARFGLDSSPPGSATPADPAGAATPTTVSRETPPATETSADDINVQPVAVNNSFDAQVGGPSQVSNLTPEQVRELNRAIAVRQYQGSQTPDVATDLTQAQTPDVATDLTQAQTPDVATDLTQAQTPDVATDLTQARAADVVADLTQVRAADVVADLTQARAADVTTDHPPVVGRRDPGPHPGPDGRRGLRPHPGPGGRRDPGRDQGRLSGPHPGPGPT